MKPEGIVQVGVNGEQRCRTALSGSDNTLTGKGTPKENQGGHQESIRTGVGEGTRMGTPRLSHIFPGYYVRVSHIFQGELCANLTHFSGEPAIVTTRLAR